jgi:decaprenyl-phosphate phosphoribosyltransferase
MTARTQETAEPRSATSSARRARGPAAVATLAVAIFQAARPRQWPKNLLVFAAPLAGASLGRHNGFVYALAAFVAFTAASSSVYLINDVLDVERDRLHPTKRLRPIASGRLPQPLAIVLALAGVVVAVLVSLLISEPLLVLVIGCYAALSLLYSAGLKHVPWLELALVANGFVMRALGGAVATHVPPSGWFLTVCSFGALMVATGKRYSELAALGPQAAAHRPVMRWYSAPLLRAFQRAAIAVLLAAYLAWALSGQTAWLRGWHLASMIPLAAALIRFDWLTGRANGRAVEDLISRDRFMVVFELAWLGLFLTGLV